VIAGKIDLNFASAAVLHCIMHRFLCNPIKLRCHKRANRERGGVAVGFHDAVNTAIPSHTRGQRHARDVELAVAAEKAFAG